MAEIVGMKTFVFGFTHFGGTNNLLPGRPEVQTRAMGRPRGSSVFVALAGINCGFINGNLDSPPLTLRERPLGQLRVDLEVNGDTLTCRMRLTDENQDDPCIMRVTVNVLFFR